MEAFMSVKVGVAFSGGGGCGFAHLGVLEVLLQNNIDIHMIAGTSMGAIVGGLYASGLSINELLEMVNAFKKSDVLDINIFKLLKSGLISGNKLEKFLNEKTNNKNIENFKIPFTAVTVNILDSKQVLLNKGNGAFAMRASSAVPGVFSACEYEDKLLVDGGVVNNLPQDVVKQMGADYVIAVDCLGDCVAKNSPKNIIDSLVISSNIMIQTIAKKSKKFYNTFIKVNTLKDGKLTNVSNLSKEAIEEAIEMGRAACRKKINKILKDLKKLGNV